MPVVFHGCEFKPCSSYSGAWPMGGVAVVCFYQMIQRSRCLDYAEMPYYYKNCLLSYCARGWDCVFLWGPTAWVWGLAPMEYTYSVPQ